MATCRNGFALLEAVAESSAVVAQDVGGEVVAVGVGEVEEFDQAHMIPPASRLYANLRMRADRVQLPARMMLRVQPLQPLARHVRVDRRRRDVGVAEQQLHDAQVGAMIQQMRRERVPQHVRRQRRRRDAGDAARSA